MKKYILKTATVVAAFTICVSAHAFTATTSGLWSNAATWGGVGPGSTVTAQDIIIPSGISVDMDVDVSFNGLANTFTVDGILNSAAAHSLWIGSGAFAGSGTTTIGSLTLSSVISSFSSTGVINVQVFSNQGATIPLSSTLSVSDSLDLSSGSILLNSGANLNMSTNASICVDNGSLVAGGGLFYAPSAYNLWYIGTTKTMGIEANSAYIQNVDITLNSNSEDLIITTDHMINGNLNLATGHIQINASRLQLSGQYDGGAGAQFETNNAELVIDGITGGMNRDLDFSSGSTLSELTIDRNATSCRLVSGVIISDSIHLQDGTLRLMTGATLTMASGSVVAVEDGAFLVTGGTFDGTLSYDVVYTGPSHVAGVEITGAGLNNLTVNLFSGGNVLSLSTNSVVDGAFNLQRGRLDLDVYSLEIAGTWNQQNTTSVLGSSSAVLNLHMASVNGDTLWFDQNAHALGDLIIQTPTTGNFVVLGSELTIHNQVNFISGKLMIGTGELYIRSGASVNGYDDTKYFITNDTGTVYQYITPLASFVTVPVGTLNSYAPVGLQSGTNATAGYISVRTMNGVLTNGTTGADMAAWETVVNHSWIIYPSATMTPEMNVRLYWLSGSEVNGFDRNNSFITHYDNSMWDNDTVAAATASPFNTYRLQRDGFTNGGVFAVADNSATLSVPEVVEGGDVSVFPNPTNDILNITIANESGSQFQYELLDASGKLVSSFSNSNATNQIDLSNVDRGYYTLRIINLSDKSVINHRVIKS